MPRLTEQAEALGYHLADNDDVEYIELFDLPQRLSETVEPEPEPEAEEIVTPYDESLGGWLAQQAEIFREQSSGFFSRTFETPEEDDDTGSDQEEEELLPGLELPTTSPEATPDA